MRPTAAFSAARMTRFAFYYFHLPVLQQRESIRDGTGGN
jgi:hypothetical protein